MLCRTCFRLFKKSAVVMRDADPYDMYVTYLKLRSAFFFITDGTSVRSCLFITSTLRHFNTPRVVVAEENVVSIVSDAHIYGRLADLTCS